MSLRRSAFILIAFLTSSAAFADLKSDLDTILNDPTLKRASVGVVVLDIKTKATLYDRNGDLLLNPASNTKLLTAAAALDQLGSGYRYTTRALRRGEIADGALNGEIVIQGSGDPMLETTDLDAMAKQIADAGIRRVTGRLLYDDSAFDGERVGDGWTVDDTIWYYGAEIGAIMVGRNAVAVHVAPGDRVGARARVRMQPANEYLTLYNHATTTKAGERASLDITRVYGTKTLVLTGSIPLGAAEQSVGTLAAPDASRYCARMFREALRRAGIEIEGGITFDLVRPDDTLVATLLSPELSKIVAPFLKRSDNLIGENLLKTLGREKRGAGTSRAGLQAAKETYTKLGMALDGVDVFDGSGLSRRGSVTARNLALLLIGMDSHKESQAFRDSLPIGGVDGTLRGRYANSPAKGRILAKTGTMYAVSALSGYVEAKSGRRYAVAIIMNKFGGASATARALQDRIMERVFADTDASK